MAHSVNPTARHGSWLGRRFHRLRPLWLIPSSFDSGPLSRSTTGRFAPVLAPPVDQETCRDINQLARTLVV